MTVMKPMRSNELEHYKSGVDSNFRSKATAIDTEINQQAQELSDKKKPTFAKILKVDKKLSSLIEAEKKYTAYIKNKDNVEDQLANQVRKNAKIVEDHLTRIGNVRSWSRESFSGYELKDIDSQPSDYFYEKLDSACFDESEKYVKKNHKLRWELQAKKDYCLNILHSGSDINSILRELVLGYKSAGIIYNIPKSLLALPSR